MRRANPASILTIAGHEYVVGVRRPSYLFFTFLIPALGGLTLLIVFFVAGRATSFADFAGQIGVGNSSAPRPVGLVDHSGLFVPVPAQYAPHFTAFPDENSARQALLAKTIPAYVVIPSDYLKTGELNSYAIGGFIESASAVDDDALNDFLVHRLLDNKVDPALAARVAAPADVTPVTLDTNGLPRSGASTASAIAGFIIPYVLSILLVIAIFTSSSYLLRSVSEEKETRVIEIVLSSVSAAELLAGKVLGLGALGLTQVGVWLLSTVLVTGGLGAVVAGLVVALSPGVFILAGVYFLLGFLLFGTLMAVAGSLGTSLRESQQVAGIFSIGATVPLWFNSLILASPNGIVARVLSYFPLTAPTTMMLRLPLANVPALDIVISMGVLVISIPFVVWGGAKIFRMGLLLTGKRPALKQIVRALREA
jgi:ABC-2 type transport system permease protein